MVEQTDAEFLAEMKALAESATGLPDVPWEARNGDVWFDGERVARDCWTPDAAFIAAARTAIPRFIAMAEKAEEENTNLKAEVRRLQTYDQAGEERDAALAEVARLREALESICRTIFVPERTEPGDLQKAVELTIAALASKE